MAANNTDLHTAKSNAADEFYTSYKDIELEMSKYKKFFKEKKVLCPCDSYNSNFYKYFRDNYHELGLAGLCAVWYPSNYDIVYDGTTEYKHEHPGNGDFKFNYTKDIMNMWCNVIVTNPPFSLFRDFIKQVINCKQNFIILGNINAVTYKEVFPHIIEKEMRLGATIHSGDREFLVPDEYPLEGTACRMGEDGRKYIRVKGVRWFTNLKPNRDETKRNKLTETYSPDKYKKFDTYDAINVNSMKEIPYDYDGVMGCPITVIDKMGECDCVEFEDPDGNILQYEIIGMLNSGGHPDYCDFAKPIIDGKCKFKRLLLKKI